MHRAVASLDFDSQIFKQNGRNITSVNKWVNDISYYNAANHLTVFTFRGFYAEALSQRILVFLGIT